MSYEEWAALWDALFCWRQVVLDNYSLSYIEVMDQRDRHEHACGRQPW